MASKKTRALSLTAAQKASIVDNLMKRVDSPQRRAQIQALALSLSNDGEDEGVYYSTLYHYQLKENWGQIPGDYNEFCTPGMFQGVSSDYQESTSPPLGNEPAVRVRPVKPQRKKKGPRG